MQIEIVHPARILSGQICQVFFKHFYLYVLIIHNRKTKILVILITYAY